MSMLGDAIGRGGRRRSEAPGALSGASPGASSPAPPASPSREPGSAPPAQEASARSELRRRRDALAEQVTELHWDLGGLAYEMAIRDHFRLDVLVRRAAVLQERDGELAEVERLLRLEESASAGGCPDCSAPHSRGAVFCWQCGATLMERSPGASSAPSRALEAGQEPSTAVMDALLAPAGARMPDGGRASESGPPANE
jgi:hypothetical protein